MHGRKNIKCTLSVKLKYAGRKKCYKQHVSFMLMSNKCSRDRYVVYCVGKYSTAVIV